MKGKIFFIPLFVLCGLLCTLVSCAPNETQLKDADVHYKMGLVYMQEREFTRSLQELVKAQEINPGDKHIWNALGIAYKEKRLYKEAEEAFKKAIDLDPKFSEAYNNLGVLFLEQGKYKEAIGSFDAALKNIFYTTPEFAYYNIGYAYQKLEQKKEAEKSFIEAINTNPSFSPAYMSLARLLVDEKRYQEAEKLLVKFLSFFDKDQEANFLLANVYYNIGEKTVAKKYFEKVIKIDSKSDFAAAAAKILPTIK